MLLSILIALYLSLGDVTASNEFVIDTEITIPQGKLKGSINLSGSVRRFLGIPYASVNGRFQEPGPASPWSGTFDATNHSPGCKQPVIFLNTFVTNIGTEDCLVLNVYTPSSGVLGPAQYPVMVFIHGGDFISGSYTNHILDPSHLVEKNNIVVSINYRVGALGFLCLRNKGAPGNVGLKDQVAGLKWVNENIEYFGGNPNSITLFGQDAGAASINYLLVNPQTSGLFHRAILQSGSMLMPQAFDDSPIESASAIAAQSGFNSTDPDKLLKFFNDLPLENLIRLTTKNIVNDPFASYVFRPCIEAPHDGALITDSPRNLLKSAKFNSNVQVIIGYNNEDGLKWATKFNYITITRVIDNIKQLIPDYLEFSKEQDKMEFAKDLQRIYFDIDDISRLEVTIGLINYFTDAYVIYPSLATTEYLLSSSNTTVFNYQFSYYSARNYGKLLASLAAPKPSLPISDYSGATNGDELFYLFKVISPLTDSEIQPLPNDTLMIYRMTMMWTYFALKGNPSIPKNTILPLATEWTESKLDDLKMMDIFFEFDMKPVQNKTRIDFWKKAYEKYGK